MKYERAERFKAEFQRLSQREQRRFLDAVRLINDVYEGCGEAPIPAWPASLRISLLTDHPGIHELTWSFAGPDGRATFEYVEVAGEVAIRWRRIGRHDIFRAP